MPNRRQKPSGDTGRAKPPPTTGEAKVGARPQGEDLVGHDLDTLGSRHEGLHAGTRAVSQGHRGNPCLQAIQRTGAGIPKFDLDDTFDGLPSGREHEGAHAAIVLDPAQRQPRCQPVDSIPRGNAAHRWQVVCDHDRRAFVMLGQRAGEPRGCTTTDRDRLGHPERPGFAENALIVAHAVFNGLGAAPTASPKIAPSLQRVAPTKRRRILLVLHQKCIRPN